MPDSIEHDAIEISVVMPCLNEEDSVGQCVAQAWAGIATTGLAGEVIVADNGSTDGSVRAAEDAGARVVRQPLRGYGNAYLAGFGAARGRMIVMGDSDGSYDFSELAAIIAPLAGGVDYVLGSRFSGEIRQGAMTWSHRYLGNPLLTSILNLLFRLNVSDAHSGFRAFTRRALDAMSLRCEGMELASEIVVRAAQAGLRVTEVPITYRRRVGESKLHPVRDGWRHLRFLLLLSPEYLFMAPGIACLATGLLSQLGLLALGGSSSVLIGKILLALLTLAGSQLITFGLFARIYSASIGAAKTSRLSEWVKKTFILERGLAGGAALALSGLVLLVSQSVGGWGPVARGGAAASAAILGLLSLFLGGELCFAAFFLTMFRLRGRAPAGAEPLPRPADLLAVPAEGAPL